MEETIGIEIAIEITVVRGCGRHIKTGFLGVVVVVVDGMFMLGSGSIEGDIGTPDLPYLRR